ncbi:tRNA(Met) cytidine acetyltransferase [Erwinia sp. S43]|uniref:tRNA(Met) cytidine acetyltransferase TmcA n=1 Tax=Erwinia sp. S43 TaxID=2769339 RepID=UPI00190D2344|nr:GNAT family N-acetyltransferase [Erwinia sp. S43]MBK0035046.1 tRNA(Met) cytidine acetyltransferase [Erwinia sp. S43]
MTEMEATAQLLRQGWRRLLVISGEGQWAEQQAARWINQLPGDWLWVGETPRSELNCLPGAMRTLLGREFQHAVFDARSGFHAEALAALAGTLKAGSWLLLLVPEWQRWPQQADTDAQRWSESDAPLASTRFVQRLQQLLLADDRVAVWRQYQPLNLPPLVNTPAWHSDSQQQQQIISALLQSEPGVSVLTAPRGRGKSALAGMLAARWPGRCLVTAPAKVSTAVLADFAGDNYAFIAPDRLLAEAGLHHADWLLIDEAAAIPAPLLRQLVLLYPRVLLTTTVQGYEGTGRGFLLKFCASLPQVKYYQLDMPLRWAKNDPLEELIGEALLFDDAESPVRQGDIVYQALEQDDWTRQPDRMAAVYQLLTSAHYRTSPLDLRRMMDAPGMHFTAALQGEAVQGALWAVDEGGLSAELAWAVWAGYRRPRGNLVAQSLAAHAGLPEAAQLRSRRISRIAVSAPRRGQGCGQRLIAICREQSEGLDFLSVSFGFTTDLWRFWQRCGFQLVRFGTQREASSGCYAAMAILPLSDAGRALLARAVLRLEREGYWLSHLLEDNTLPLNLQPGDGQLNKDDWCELAGFAWAHRPFEASLAALGRLAQLMPESAPLLCAALLQRQSATEICRQYRLAGRKALLLAWRAEAQRALAIIDAERALIWQQRVILLQ